MRVLVVDDDKLARKGLISIMNWEKYGFEVVDQIEDYELLSLSFNHQKPFFVKVLNK